MNRRSFLGSIIAAAAAPAIVRADSLMRVVPRDALLLHEYSNNVWLDAQPSNVWMWHTSTREWSQLALPAGHRDREDSALASIEHVATLGAFVWRAGDRPALEVFALVPPDWQDPREGWHWLAT